MGEFGQAFWKAFCTSLAWSSVALCIGLVLL